LYRATEPSRSLAARAVRQIIDRFCQGSVEELVSGMVEAKALNGDELRRLEAFARDRRKGGK
jgi:predicted transcriptional regulator